MNGLLFLASLSSLTSPSLGSQERIAGDRAGYICSLWPSKLHNDIPARAAAKSQLSWVFDDDGFEGKSVAAVDLVQIPKQFGAGTRITDFASDASGLKLRFEGVGGQFSLTLVARPNDPGRYEAQLFVGDETSAHTLGLCQRIVAPETVVASIKRRNGN